MISRGKAEGAAQAAWRAILPATQPVGIRAKQFCRQARGRTA